MSGGSGGGKRFGLSIKKRDEVDAKRPKPTTSSVFNDDDSSGDETKPKSSAAERFDEKYSSGSKRSDKQLVEKAIAEDPTIFEYDSIHEKLEKQRDRATAEQKEADKEKKPKYAQSIINAHKKRELDQLLHDERVYEKEREAESGAFDEKEVFITGAYRQKMEEREQFRVEQAREDALNALTKVEDQGLWKSAFQSHMLGLRTGIEEDTTTQQSMKLEPTGEVVGEKPDPPIANKQIKEEEMKKVSSKERKMSTREGHQGKDSEEERREKRISPSLRGRRSRSHDRRDSLSHHRRHHRPSPDRNPRGGERDKAPAESVRPREEKSLCEKEREAQEINRRMAKIRAVLEKRNGDAEVEEARKRYMERKEQGLIVPPLC